MRLSKTCTYAIQASLYLASRNDERKYVPISEIADRLDLSYHFLTKILQSMSAKRLVKSLRGPNGGVGLAKPASEISILDVVTAVDRGGIFDGCLLGMPGCGESMPCPLHDSWQVARDRMKDSFRTMSLGQLAANIQKGEQRISGDGIGFL